MSLIQQNWVKTEIKTPTQLEELWKKDNPTAFAIDTETDGLFHMTMKPFLIIFGWLNKNSLNQVVTFEPTKELLSKMYELCGTVKMGFMHNGKFDLHALENTGFGYPHKNIIDTMVIARLVLPAIPADAMGGIRLGLKPLADRFIEKGSSDSQQDLKSLMSDVKRVYKVAGKPEPSYKDIYSYSNTAKEIMIKYASDDVILTLELAQKFWPFIKASGQTEILIEEMHTMYALFRSERIGMKIDTKYVQKAKVRMEKYIETKFKNLKKLLNDDTIDEKTFVSSSKMIKEWFEKMGIPQKSTAQDVLKELISTDIPENIKHVLTEILKIRKLLKKYKTDLLGYVNNDYNGRRYTSYKMTATVTGRLSNDMQQQPNEGISEDEASEDDLESEEIVNEDGLELFHPRKAIIVSGKDYPAIVYFDYSQIELRLQAHYTWLATKGQGDVNLLRMFVPFNCYRLEDDKKIYWEVKKEFDNYTWFTIENNEPWQVTDMHLLTARQAFVEIAGLPKDDPRVQKRRKQAKTVNFAMQYGAGLKTVQERVGDVEAATKLYEANKAAFPGIKAYGTMLQNDFARDGYCENAYGRKYKLKAFSYKLNNYVIQGTGAEILKRKIIEIDAYLSNKKSRLIHNIHDEVQIEMYKDENYIIKDIMKIMADTGDKFVVPILPDAEITYTNWFEKKDWEEE